MYQAAEYKKLVLELDKRGFQIMTHNYRPDTAQLVVDAYEEVEKVNGPRDRRLRMEHTDFVPAEDIPRMAKHSMIASMQPTFCCDENGSNFDPKDRTTTDRWQSMEKSGVTLAFGSDWPCTWPPNPLGGDSGGRDPHDLAASRKAGMIFPEESLTAQARAGPSRPRMCTFPRSG